MKSSLLLVLLCLGRTMLIGPQKRKNLVGMVRSELLGSYDADYSAAESYFVQSQEM